MISGTVIYDVRPVVNQLFAAPGVTVSIYNADTTQTVWLSTRAGGLKAGLGIPLPPNGLIAWDADKDCYAVSAGPDVLVAVTDNSGALNFQGPTLTQITAAVPTAATIDGQPNSANAASRAASALTAASTAATNAANALTAASNAASNSAIARIRSMTRLAFTTFAGVNTLTLPVAITAARSQVSMSGSHVTNPAASPGDILLGTPVISGVSDTAITVTRISNSWDASGLVEVMEWI